MTSPFLLLLALAHATPATSNAHALAPRDTADVVHGSVQVVPPLPQGDGPMVDSVVVEKRAHRLSLFYAHRRVRQYLVALGSPVGDKLSAGDRRTPEGLFFIDYRNPASQYHLALHVSYPDSAHLVRAAAKGVQPGGDIMIHGLPNGLRAAGASHRENDWTNGCIALTDEEIEELWRIVPVGTPVEIRP
ncbi:MAG TPA: L,D-transpeptidase family protein [Gemmatimonadaceae bacterium]|jgi:murein L,D-transpeptidase YafK